MYRSKCWTLVLSVLVLVTILQSATAYKVRGSSSDGCPSEPIGAPGQQCNTDSDCPSGSICCDQGFQILSCVPGLRIRNHRRTNCQQFNCADRGITCPNGFVIGVDGCQLSCECDGCPRINCPIDCEHGFRTDADGCPICGCNPPPGGCEVFNCAEQGITCPNGFVFGVDTCQLGCGCDGCPRIDCGSLTCPETGFQVDNERCPICACNSPPPSCKDFQCAEKGITCPNGFVFGVDGCQLGCGCDGCPRIDCGSLTCPRTGFKVDRDECPICACNKKSYYNGYRGHRGTARASRPWRT